MVAITCNVNVNLLGKDSFQEIDIAGITMPVTKHNFIVKDVNKLADTIRRAFAIAQTGRPGPVLVDIPKDVTGAEAEYEYKVPAPIKRKSDQISEETMQEVIGLIEHSVRPFILVGGGVIRADAADELREFVSKVQAPVADTLMGKGAFDGREDAYTGMVGMHGTKTSNYGITESDLLIAIGTRFSDRVLGNVKAFARHADLVHIDVDAAEVNKNVMCKYSIEGDAKVVLQRLNEKLTQQDHEPWMRHIREMKSRYPMTYNHEVLTGPGVVESIYKATDGDAIICTEVGQNQMWAAQFYKYKEPRQFISSGGLGTMGYGLGAALGAKLGCPDRIVINVAGDGCFRMNMNELATASRYQIPVIEVVVNNHVLGMVRQWQTLFFDKHYSNTTLNRKNDFAAVAKAFGADGEKVLTEEELDEAFIHAFNNNGPYVIDCSIDKDEFVLPMLPPGGSMDDIITKMEVE